MFPDLRYDYRSRGQRHARRSARPTPARRTSQATPATLGFRRGQRKWRAVPPRVSRYPSPQTLPWHYHHRHLARDLGIGIGNSAQLRPRPCHTAYGARPDHCGPRPRGRVAGVGPHGQVVRHGATGPRPPVWAAPTARPPAGAGPAERRPAPPAHPGGGSPTSRVRGGAPPRPGAAGLTAAGTHGWRSQTHCVRRCVLPVYAIGSGGARRDQQEAIGRRRDAAVAVMAPADHVDRAPGDVAPRQAWHRDPPGPPRAVHRPRVLDHSLATPPPVRGAHRTHPRRPSPPIPLHRPPTVRSAYFRQPAGSRLWAHGTLFMPVEPGAVLEVFR